jgi:hypothetical protein
MDGKSVKDSTAVVQGLKDVNTSAAEPFVKPVVVSQYLGIDPGTVIRFARAGVIPGHPLRVSGRRTHWRFLISEIRETMLARIPSGQAKRRSTNLRNDKSRRERQRS